MALNIQGGALCCALECVWTSLPCFCEDDGSIAIVGTRNFGGRSISKLTLFRLLADRFLVWFGIYVVAAHFGSFSLHGRWSCWAIVARCLY